MCLLNINLGCTLYCKNLKKLKYVYFHERQWKSWSLTTLYCWSFSKLSPMNNSWSTSNTLPVSTCQTLCDVGFVVVKLRNLLQLPLWCSLLLRCSVVGLLTSIIVALLHGDVPLQCRVVTLIGFCYS